MRCPEHLNKGMHVAPGTREEELNRVRRMGVWRSGLGGGDSEFKGKKEMSCYNSGHYIKYFNLMLVFVLFSLS